MRENFGFHKNLLSPETILYYIYNKVAENIASTRRLKYPKIVQTFNTIDTVAENIASTRRLKFEMVWDNDQNTSHVAENIASTRRLKSRIYKNGLAGIAVAENIASTRRLKFYKR